MDEIKKGESLEGYYSLKNEGKPAGKIFLKIALKK